MAEKSVESPSKTGQTGKIITHQYTWRFESPINMEILMRFFHETSSINGRCFFSHWTVLVYSVDQGFSNQVMPRGECWKILCRWGWFFGDFFMGKWWMKWAGQSGFGKCSIVGDIEHHCPLFVGDNISIVGWCSIRTFANPYQCKSKSSEDVSRRSVSNLALKKILETWEHVSWSHPMKMAPWSARWSTELHAEGTCHKRWNWLPNHKVCCKNIRYISNIQIVLK